VRYATRPIGCRLGSILSITVLALACAACGGPDAEQIRLCERLIPALEDHAVEIVGREEDPAAPYAVIVRYRTALTAERHWVSCRFGGGGVARDRMRLVGVVTDRRGPLSEVEVFLLRQYWLDLYEGQGQATDQGAPTEEGGARGALYLAQIGVNGITLGGIYGLLAIGYTLVYGIIGRINLAFGEIAMIGAYATFIGIAAIALLGPSALPLGLIVVLLAAAAIGAVHGFVTERLVFRPLREVPSQAPLIATVGLAIFLQEYLRLGQGASERWIQPVFTRAHELVGDPGFAVTVTTGQILIMLLVLLMYGLLWLLMARSRFGRAARACADDVGMAALCGVDVDRTVALTFSLGAAYAGIAGFVILLRYGGVSFYDGLLVGFKALTAAILGGIGSVPGAMLGGLLVGLLEAGWAGYLAIAYKDVAIFALLAAMLALRPHGLLGQPVRLANDQFRARPA
jgi:branched-chain amino acid transport system permease protein